MPEWPHRHSRHGKYTYLVCVLAGLPLSRSALWACGPLPRIQRRIRSECRTLRSGVQPI